MPANGPPLELDSRPQSRREWSGWLRSLVLPLGLVAAIVGLLFYLEAARGRQTPDGSYGIVGLPPDRNATAASPAPEQGRAAPDFVLETLDGGELRLSDLQGRPILVNFWATWCVSCRAEMPDLVSTYESRSQDGFVLLGINLREANARVQPFVDDFGMTFPVLMDRSGEVARTWRIGGPNEGVPSSYFIDSQGIVKRVVYGTLTTKALDDGLALIMGSGE